jgi:hypothetical protein
MCFVYHATGPASLGSGRPPFHMGQTLESGSNTSMTFSSHARQDTSPYSKLSKTRNSNQPQRISSSNLNCSRYRDTSATAATPLSLYIYLSLSTYPNPLFHEKTSNRDQNDSNLFVKQPTHLCLWWRRLRRDVGLRIVALSEGDVKPFSYGLLVEGDSARIRPGPATRKPSGSLRKLILNTTATLLVPQFKKKKLPLHFWRLSGDQGIPQIMVRLRGWNIILFRSIKVFYETDNTSHDVFGYFLHSVWRMLWS